MKRGTLAIAIAVLVIAILVIGALQIPSVSCAVLTWAARWKDVVEAAVAFGTILLAVFTAGMALSTNRLAQESAASVKASKDAYLQAERHHQQRLAPVLVCEQLVFNPSNEYIMTTQDATTTVTTQWIKVVSGTIQNIGAGPAIDIEMDIVYNDHRHGEGHSQALRLHPLAPGKQSTLSRQEDYLGEWQLRIEIDSKDDDDLERAMLTPLSNPEIRTAWQVTFMYGSPFNDNRYATVYEQQFGGDIRAKIIGQIIAPDREALNLS